MKLKFKQKYLSIDQFSDVEIPNFIVLTGVNGSGKSHLLSAIENKQVILEGLENSTIVHFNNESFKLKDESEFTPYQLSSERQAAWNFFIQSKNTNIKNVIEANKRDLGISYEKILKISKNKNKPLWDLSKADIGDESIFVKIKIYKQQIRNNFRDNHHLKNNAQAQGILVLIKKLNYSIDEIDEYEFKEMYIPHSFKDDFLPMQLGKVFVDYYSKNLQNATNETLNKKYNQNNKILTNEEFLIKHGGKPWEICNEILEKFKSLTYSVNSPEGINLSGGFKLQLAHTEKENIFPSFSELSSGERTLMALVASIYKASSDSHFPDILLLDEIDASLHPSMMQNLLDVVHDVFLSKGMKVILVTHSPTTIALAPSESIFVMKKSGENRIVKKSKTKALEILTSGFATLSEGKILFESIIKSDKKIILFTEGKTDVKHIQLAKEKLRVDEFDIFSCGSADKLKQFLIGVPSGMVDDKIIIGIFDYDDEGLKCIKKVGEQIEENKQYKVRDSNNIFAITLPCPNKEFEKHKNCPIEFLYTKNILEKQLNFLKLRNLKKVNANLNTSESLNLEELKRKRGLYFFEISEKKVSKNLFTYSVNNLEKKEFVNFIPLFNKIKEISNCV